MVMHSLATTNLWSACPCQRVRRRSPLGNSGRLSKSIWRNQHLRKTDWMRLTSTHWYGSVELAASTSVCKVSLDPTTMGRLDDSLTHLGRTRDSPFSLDRSAGHRGYRRDDCAGRRGSDRLDAEPWRVPLRHLSRQPPFRPRFELPDSQLGSRGAAGTRGWEVWDAGRRCGG